MRRKVNVRRAVEATDLDPDFAGVKRVALAARTAASSSSANPHDETTSTRSTDPDSPTRISRPTSPCSPRWRAPFGYSGRIALRGFGGASTFACFGATAGAGGAGGGSAVPGHPAAPPCPPPAIPACTGPFPGTSGMPRRTATGAWLARLRPCGRGARPFKTPPPPLQAAGNRILRT